jgi:pimeloyl-ACP methyl ester carboxylesterase
MPIPMIRGVEINYRVLDELGPWIALQPGGARGLGIASIAEKIAEPGNWVLVYDRRNCGASGVSCSGRTSENEIWAEDLHTLPKQLDALPVFVGGSSSGCRLALLLALRHPAVVLLWRLTRGAYAAQRLPLKYLHAVRRASPPGRHGGGVRERAFRRSSPPTRRIAAG